MIELFNYNWQVRNDWFTWCGTLSVEELTKKRVGGIGSILHTLYHVVNCEQLWINQMLGKPVLTRDMNTIVTLEEVIRFSEETKLNTLEFLQSWSEDEEVKNLVITSKNGQTYTFPYGKVVRHIITHEIHHIGQLSIWSRELGKKPVSSDLIFRDYK
ncbi:damage-inducible protein DinB [Anaerobacillus alkaliphilus]|uniref:Damage-inducible protein DinB n=1 Tax=Anaerobacillus alkaliphilus TaxID=1548597 RepID=A0A4Q0VYC5_9BACI|nr:DinB family protein [Anaerobacillus alkaliphilus]RXJ04559.1 damage-inducible protein DinB [Anaerobacillus alkaliphilus]